MTTTQFSGYLNFSRAIENSILIDRRAIVENLLARRLLQTYFICFMRKIQGVYLNDDEKSNLILPHSETKWLNLEKKTK